MIKALLFDADGVLFFHPDKMFSERIIAEYDADPIEIADFFEHVFPDCLVGKKDLKQELSARARDWNWPGSADDLMDYWFAYEHDTDKPLIEYIRGLKQNGLSSYVATNNDHYRAAWLFNHLNLDTSVFDKLYAAGHLGVAKPNHQFFQFILNDMPHVQKEEVLFWDDSPANIESAQEFGINAEIYSDFSDFMAKMERYV